MNEMKTKTSMNKQVIWMMAVILTLCGSAMFTSCSSDDDNDEILQPDDNGANSSDEEIGYIECSWDGTKVVKTAKAVKAENIINYKANTVYDIILESGACYVSGKHDIKGVYLIDGGKKVDLILCDGAELSIWGIKVDGDGSRLRIFGQDKGTGKLNVIPASTGQYAGIGTYSYGGCDLEFHGGNIVVKGPNAHFTGGPGIGCGIEKLIGANSGFNSIIIYDGTINATGGNDAAGIGGNQESPNGYGHVYIYGGTVTAQGGEYAAGIGGGDNKRLASINIFGGTVTAYSGVDGAGIGGGEDGDSGDINIYGGVVRAYGDRNASGSHKGFGAGIGSGQDGSVNTIRIYGGDIEAYGGEDAAGIGTGEEFEADGIISGTIEIYGGKVYAEGKGYGAGIGAGEDATFGVMGISGGRVEAKAGGDCGNWSGAIGAYHSKHSDGCEIGWAGWERIYIGAGMRLYTYSDGNGYTENVNTAGNQWWDFVHQRPKVIFDVCDHEGWAVCPLCYPYTIQLR